MTISEMYENNKNVKDLEEEIANHNAVIASGKKVGEMYFEQLKSMKEKYSSMSVISEKQIDDKVNEYEKKLDEYEKNNNRINELSELIESHNAMVISGRQVSEGYFKQIEEYKKELASMREIPHNKIMAYKRELAIAYKEKIKSAPEINKRYDETKEMVENHRAMFASGRIVGEKYGEQLVNNENKISELKRVSKTDIDKWEKVIEDVEKDDKEIGKLKELIETQQSLMVSGIIGGKDAVKKQDELKRQLKERMISVKEIEENDKTVKDQGNNLPAIIKKENISVYFNILYIESCIALFSPLTLKEENSGISSPLKELKKVLGNSIIGKTIPLIIPYLERASLQLKPDASSFNGITTCFSVASPDFI